LTEELQTLHERVLAMGRLVQGCLAMAVRALIERDSDATTTIIAGDDDIDRFQVEIDDRCFTLLALQHPTAVHLRTIVAATKVSGDLERVGDLVANIAKATKRYLSQPPLMPIEEIGRMADLSQSMLRDALEAFVSQSVEAARAVLNREDALDQLQAEVFNELLTSMWHDRRTAEPALDLVRISRHLERIGDHATTIAEDVIFIVAAHDMRHHLPATAL
jgi:phosphate transport system protein